MSGGARGGTKGSGGVFCGAVGEDETAASDVSPLPTRIERKSARMSCKLRR